MLHWPTQIENYSGVIGGAPQAYVVHLRGTCWLRNANEKLEQ